MRPVYCGGPPPGAIGDMDTLHQLQRCGRPRPDLRDQDCTSAWSFVLVALGQSARRYAVLGSKQVIDRTSHQSVSLIGRRHAFKAEPEVDRPELGVVRSHGDHGAFLEPDIRGAGPVVGIDLAARRRSGDRPGTEIALERLGPSLRLTR